jgi:hypothetical protein
VRILYYNPKLAWVAVSAAVWALLAFGWAVAWHGRPEGPLRLGYGPEFITVKGRLVAVEEQPDKLLLTIAATPDNQRVLRHNKRELEQLPADLEIRFVGPDAAVDQPRLSLLPGSGKQRRFGRGRFEIGTRLYVVKYSGGIVRINHPPPDTGRGNRRRGGPGWDGGEQPGRQGRPGRGLERPPDGEPPLPPPPPAGAGPRRNGPGPGGSGRGGR